MTAPIEARPYGPDSTPEEIEALRARVYMHTDEIAMFREVPVPTPFEVGICMAKLDELLLDPKLRYVIVDFSEAGRPSAEVREFARSRFAAYRGRVRHMAFFTGRNVLMNIAIRFVLSNVFPQYSVHKTLAEAEEAIRNAAE